MVRGIGKTAAGFFQRPLVIESGERGNNEEVMMMGCLANQVTENSTLLILR